MKDNFSSHAAAYSRYRPDYPKELFEYISSVVSVKEHAWDCGTGNGQAAIELVRFFEKVYATDISQKQIDEAVKANNIFYSVQAAESTRFKSDFFDLIVTAQAIHWFDFDSFYAEVLRTARSGAFICIIGYGLIQTNKQTDQLINRLYSETLKPFWDPERRYIDEHYKTIPFPFEEISTPVFINKLLWTREQLIGYLNTWSAVKHYIREKGHNPVADLEKEIEKNWNADEKHEICFPVLFRMGKIK
jgi:SAM-dependent methyltransferase